MNSTDNPLDRLSNEWQRLEPRGYELHLCFASGPETTDVHDRRQTLGYKILCKHHKLCWDLAVAWRNLGEGAWDTLLKRLKHTVDRIVDGELDNPFCAECRHPAPSTI